MQQHLRMVERGSTGLVELASEKSIVSTDIELQQLELCSSVWSLWCTGALTRPRPGGKQVVFLYTTAAVGPSSTKTDEITPVHYYGIAPVKLLGIRLNHQLKSPSTPVL